MYTTIQRPEPTQVVMTKFGWSHHFSFTEDKIRTKTNHEAYIGLITPTVVTRICLEPVKYWKDNLVNNSKIQNFCKEKMTTETGQK